MFFNLLDALRLHSIADRRILCHLSNNLTTGVEPPLLRLIQLDYQSAIHTQKINLPANQKGYNIFETAVGKLLTRRIQICRVHFPVITFDLYLLKQVNIWLQKNGPDRFGFALSNTRLPRSQTLLRCLGSMTNYVFS